MFSTERKSLQWFLFYKFTAPVARNNGIKISAGEIVGERSDKVLSGEGLES